MKSLYIEKEVKSTIFVQMLPSTVIPVDGPSIGGEDGVVKGFLLGRIHQVEGIREVLGLQSISLFLHLLQVIIIGFLIILIFGVIPENMRFNN